MTVTTGDDPALKRARALFALRFGEGARLFRAPGRINIIGEHTDYAGGFVLPAAIARDCVVAARAHPERRLRVRAADLREEAVLDLGQLMPRHDWTDYVAGVAAMLAAEGFAVAGADMVIASDVPVGAGLSSSAALEVAVLAALTALGGMRLDGRRAAQIAQAAENRFVGMPCGIMDQFASANAVAGHALLLDCRSLEARPVPLPEAARFIIVNSMEKHALVDGEYARRRRECEEAAAVLGVPQLRDVPPATLDDALARLSGGPRKRARHVVSEIARTLDAVAALEAGDLSALGRLLSETHASLRDDMEVSIPALDTLQAIAAATPGILGARLMGGGFGGSIIALAEAGAAAAAVRAIVDAYRRETGVLADAFICETADGAGEVAA